MNEFEKALFGNWILTSKKIIRPNASSQRGIRLGYPDGTRAIFWFNDKKYFIRVELLGTIFNVITPKHIAEKIFQGFYDKYQTFKDYEDV